MSFVNTSLRDCHIKIIYIHGILHALPPYNCDGSSYLIIGQAKNVNKKLNYVINNSANYKVI